MRCVNSNGKWYVKGRIILKTENSNQSVDESVFRVDGSGWPSLKLETVHLQGASFISISQVFMSGER